jgi:hypothetical protein
MSRRLIAPAIACAIAHALAAAQGQVAAPETELRQSRDIRSFWPMVPGRLLARTTSIPMHLRYEEMTPVQQDQVKGQYERLGPNDEPPFPEAGLAPLIKAVHQAQTRLLVEGDLFLVAEIDATGLPRKVAAYSSPSSQMTRVASQILMLTRFKPARCAGEPCTQQFPLHLLFKVEQ